MAFKIHALTTGTVAVKKAHYSFGGPEPLRFPAILADPRWTDPLPVRAWAIEHPEGTLLIDTGESARFHAADHFHGDPTGFVNRRILRIAIREEEEIDLQLSAAGIAPQSVGRVVLTHLHIDHTDGLRHFPQAEILVSRTEWENPYGAALKTFPPWLKPRLIDYRAAENEAVQKAFGGGFPLTSDGALWLVPTPGHTLGHQSVLLVQEGRTCLFAGDASFSEDHLKRSVRQGIALAPSLARQTNRRLIAYMSENPTIYLPSHDPEAEARLCAGALFGDKMAV